MFSQLQNPSSFFPSPLTLIGSLLIFVSTPSFAQQASDSDLDNDKKPFYLDACLYTDAVLTVTKH